MIIEIKVYNVVEYVLIKPFGNSFEGIIYVINICINLLKINVVLVSTVYNDALFIKVDDVFCLITACVYTFNNVSICLNVSTIIIEGDSFIFVYKLNTLISVSKYNDNNLL